MSHKKSQLQIMLYQTFVASGAIAVVLGLLLIWGYEPEKRTGLLLVRILATCLVIAVASAFAMSATRLVEGRPPEDDAG